LLVLTHKQYETDRQTDKTNGYTAYSKVALYVAQREKNEFSSKIQAYAEMKPLKTSQLNLAS